MNPRMNAGGLCLASASTHNPLPDCALASPTDTLGSMTNYPYSSRTCRMSSVPICALFYSGSQVLSYLVLRNQIPALAGNAPTVSLSGFKNPSANNGWSEVRVSSGSMRILAQLDKTCKWFSHLADSGQFIPAVFAGGFLARSL